MFRKMRRLGQQLSDEECIEILINEPPWRFGHFG